ncbi:hypothetical protein EGI26_16260 [Lacihabitans sp. CCS-44]|nr:hypothetical protein [Lacihabitans sp. CCS-44]
MNVYLKGQKYLIIALFFSKIQLLFDDNLTTNTNRWSYLYHSESGTSKKYYFLMEVNNKK